MDPSDDDCSFASLATKASYDSHRQLTNLIHTLPSKVRSLITIIYHSSKLTFIQDDATRKQLILQYAIHTRHKFARLLVAVRWLRQHGRLIEQTILADNAADDNTSALKHVVESLWNAHALSNSTALPKPAVAPAVDLLTSPKSSPHIQASLQPHLHEKRLLSDISHVTNSNSVNPSSSKPQSSSLGSVSPSVTDRLAVATRNCIRESLLHLGYLRVLSWRSGIADVCVTVGVPTLWSADISLDSLDPESAHFRVHSLDLLLRNNPDAALTTPKKPTPYQIAVLRRMADDRMIAAVNASNSMAKNNSLNATCVMLCALRDMMMYDVCAPLAMDYLRAQALALSLGPWKQYVQVTGAASDTPRSQPLVIKYWLTHRNESCLSLTEVQQTPQTLQSHISSPQSTGSLQTDIDVNCMERPPACVMCAHQPTLPGMVELGGSQPAFVLQNNSLDIEQLLLSSIRTRIRARLYSLSQYFDKQHTQLGIDRACVVLSNVKRNCTDGPVQSVSNYEDVLSIQFGKHGHTGMQVRIFNMTGATRIRPYGAASLPLPVQRGRDVHLWNGAQFFESDAKEMLAVRLAFEAVRARVKLNASARSVCALDIGVSNTLPPGTASVAATASPDRAASQLVPPFAPLERRAPRRFLTLSPPPPAKDALHSMHGVSASQSRHRTSSSRGVDRSGPSKRPRLTYATTSDALVFIQESSIPGEEWLVDARERVPTSSKPNQPSETESIDRYSGTAAATAAWAITREVVERRLRRDSLLRAFVAANVASAAQMHHLKTSEDGDLHLDSASKVLLKVKCEPLPVRRAELLLRGYDAWQVRLYLLPSIFDSTDPIPNSGDNDVMGSANKSKGEGNIWSVGVACTGSQLTFTYPSANAASVRSFFRDLTRARTAAALARGVPPSRFYRVLRRSPVRIVVGIGPYGLAQMTPRKPNEPPPKPDYTATVEYVYSKGNSGGFSLSFSPSKQTMELLAPLIEEALDASGGQVGGILAGLLERACPVAAAAESAVRQLGKGRIRIVNALRVRAVFAPKRTSKPGTQPGSSQTEQGVHQSGHVVHAVDVDARGGSGRVTVIDVGRATAVMVQHGLAQRTGFSNGTSSRRNDYVSLPHWDEKVAALTRNGYADAQRAASTVVLRMEMLETFLKDLVSSAGFSEES